VIAMKATMSPRNSRYDPLSRTGATTGTCMLPPACRPMKRPGRRVIYRTSHFPGAVKPAQEVILTVTPSLEFVGDLIHGWGFEPRTLTKELGRV